ncbi:gp70 [Escherichia phage N4]|uniref:Gp70 n=1 Tax=Enterobacteria phage N4 TaxID=2886925 RepID=A0MZF2_BPN4|nr:gp70 [Escherichia phage N4]ABK54431.1 gp70 [Escherichia phage N4]
MRLFYSFDGNDQWNEIDFSKIGGAIPVGGAIPGDHILCHDEESFHYISGMMLINNVTGFTVHKPAPVRVITKPIEGLAFFTRIPQSISIKRQRDAIEITVVA